MMPITKQQRHRKEEMQKQHKEEIAKLKALKREEIIDQLKKADHLAKGNLFKDRHLLERVQKELETPIARGLVGGSFVEGDALLVDTDLNARQLVISVSERRGKDRGKTHPAGGQQYNPGGCRSGTNPPPCRDSPRTWYPQPRSILGCCR